MQVFRLAFKDASKAADKLIMNRKAFFIIAAITSCLTASALWSYVQTGSPAPEFRVSDGNGVSLDSSSLRGKVIVGFYESRDKIEENAQLKAVLKKYYSDNIDISAKNVFMLSVIDCSPANFMTRPIWRKGLVRNSEQNGLTVYGDWDGSMKQAYGMPDDESVFLLIDKKGVIKYIYPGRVPEKYFGGIKDLTGKLCME